MNLVEALLHPPSGLLHISGSLSIMPGCATQISAPHLAHLKRAWVILGLTVVTFLARPSTATSLRRWSALRSRISTFASLGRLNILTLISSPGRLMLGTRDMTVLRAISRQRSGSSSTNMAKSTLIALISA